MTEKEQQAQKIVKNHMWWSMGAGLIPVPLADLAAISGVQLKMLAEISQVYGVAFQENRGKAIVAALGGTLVPHATAFGTVGSIIKHIPGVGALAGMPAMAVFAGAYCWALGHVFIQHYESGGTFLSFDPEQVKEHFKAEFEGGQKVAAALEAQATAEAGA